MSEIKLRIDLPEYPPKDIVGLEEVLLDITQQRADRRKRLVENDRTYIFRIMLFMAIGSDIEEKDKKIMSSLSANLLREELMISMIENLIEDKLKEKGGH